MKTMVTILLVLLASASFSRADTDRENAEKRLHDAAEVLQQIMSAPDKGIPEEVIKGAKCIAVIPHEIKGGFVVGARHGKGVATCRTASGWSAPAFFTITGGSWGAQIGLEAIDNVLMIMNQKGMERLLSNKFEIGADASAAAGPVGRHAAARYGGKASFREVLLGRVPPPPAARTFLAAVRGAELQAKK
jgi:lipid-binding SYLF domain-containing protein